MQWGSSNVKNKQDNHSHFKVDAGTAYVVWALGAALSVVAAIFLTSSASHVDWLSPASPPNVLGNLAKLP